MAVLNIAQISFATAFFVYYAQLLLSDSAQEHFLPSSLDPGTPIHRPGWSTCPAMGRSTRSMDNDSQGSSLEARCLAAECAEPSPVAPKGLSTQSAIATLTQNILGSGVLALPFAMSSAGIAGGVAMLLLVYSMSVFTMGVLVALSNALGTFSYKGAAEHTLGHRLAVWVEIWVLCCNIGLCTSYPILLGDFGYALSQQLGFAEWTSRKGCMAVMVGCICWPLSCAPSLGFLRGMSLLGLASICFCAVCAGIRYFDGSYYTGAVNLDMLRLDTFGDCFPILVGAFGAHTNIPLLYREVAPQAGASNFGDTQAGRAAFRQMMSVIGCSLSIACVVYGCYCKKKGVKGPLRVGGRPVLPKVVGCICWPLSCAPSLGFLRGMSLLGLASICFCAVCAGIRYFDGSYYTGAVNLDMLRLDTFGDCFPILVGAFGAHTNIPLLYREVAPQAGASNFGDTQAGRAAFRQMMSVIGCSLSIACVVYGLLQEEGSQGAFKSRRPTGSAEGVGIVVYATFGSSTKSDFSENFRADDNLLAVLRVTMMCAICGSYSLMLMSARAAAFNLFLQPHGLEMTRLWRIAISTALTAFCFGVAVAADQISTVLAYNGSGKRSDESALEAS
ncbi:putative sodium-coupled neutral amino acid transporter 6 [Symbiodinium microadriaticum]|uniref:Putative sodium-coupled neutral amino acid transporter 6 n=1 Tax=Symbiodinium microadriaticum TaxID=2951 RepID=A0A1Q9EUC5_SYMMI|nr:putative sodium-coupled neutral amino acid transporter 6 [Symbiodinium microadriaticum]